MFELKFDVGQKFYDENMQWYNVLHFQCKLDNKIWITLEKIFDNMHNIIKP